MDWPVLVAKVVGVVLFAFTIRSIYRHVRDKRKAAAQNQQDKQSTSERILNGILLYAWYAFMVAFSCGLVVNNRFGGY